MATQIRGSTQIMAGTILDAQIAAGANIASSKLADGANWIKKDGSVTFTAAISHGGFAITNLGSPTNPGDAATKSYVDNLVGTGISVKAAVLYSTTANINLTGLATQAGGDWSATLTTADRILVKSQTDATANGIYTAASGAWTRATDFNSATNILVNSFVFVAKGSTLGDTGWVLTTDPPITLGTSLLTFAQFSSAGIIVAGNGLTKTSNTLDVNVGNGLTLTGNAVTVLAADATINVSASGVKLSALNSGNVFVGNASNVATSTAMSGDVTITNSGVTTVTASIPRYSAFVFSETPSGAINGSNTTYSLANTPQSGTVSLHLNGVRQNPGAGNDYTISGTTVTYVTAPNTGDVLLVDYLK